MSTSWNIGFLSEWAGRGEGVGGDIGQGVAAPVYHHRDQVEAAGAVSKAVAGYELRSGAGEPALLPEGHLLGSGNGGIEGTGLHLNEAEDLAAGSHDVDFA